MVQLVLPTSAVYIVRRHCHVSFRQPLVSDKLVSYIYSLVSDIFILFQTTLFRTK